MDIISVFFSEESISHQLLTSFEFTRNGECLFILVCVIHNRILAENHPKL